MTPAQLIRRAPVGKIVGGTLYIHISALDTLPDGLLELVTIAADISEDTGSAATLVKIDRSGAIISFLEYPAFDTDPHPALHRAVTVNLDNERVRATNYRANRPILHRKETFVDKDYPNYEVFANLTADEDAAGLLGRSDIGREDQWADVLEAQAWTIRDHQLVSLIERRRDVL